MNSVLSSLNVLHVLHYFLEEIKIIVIVDWIFYVQDFLRSFMIAFKYGLILLRYSSVDTILFLSPLLSYSIYFLLQKLVIFTLKGS